MIILISLGILYSGLGSKVSRFETMSSVCLLILCGVPGAGKSTWVQHFISFIQTLNDNLGDMMSNNCLENDSDFGERQDKKATSNHYEVIHIAYDSLIDEELETQLIETSSNHSEEKNVFY